MKRYVELKFEDKIITEPFTIDEILIKNKFDWFLDCEVENVKLEILKGHLIFNSGVFFNGNWKYGVFRDGQWKYGTWEGGVWYNGTWYNGIFKSGIIFDGRFLSGKFENGEIRGGDFGNSAKFSEKVIRVDKGEQKLQIIPQPVQPEKIGENLIIKFSVFELNKYLVIQDIPYDGKENLDRVH